MLEAEIKWSWSTKCGKAFREAKKQIASAKVLAHYVPTLPIKLAADASAYGIGAVTSHRMPDGTKRPIAFASKTLTKSEKNYTQLEKENLSLIYRVKKFHQCLYSRKFTLLTEHRPLTHIFHPNKGIPSHMARCTMDPYPCRLHRTVPRENVFVVVDTHSKGLSVLVFLLRSNRDQI